MRSRARTSTPVEDARANPGFDTEKSHTLSCVETEAAKREHRRCVCNCHDHPPIPEEFGVPMFCIYRGCRVTTYTTKQPQVVGLLIPNAHVADNSDCPACRQPGVPVNMAPDVNTV